MQQLILHIDFDSFFASVEQQDNPLFRNRPLGVTATNGRNCIIAASREAKKAGVKSPSRTYEAKIICPQIAFAPAHFVRYWEVSKKFITICNEFSPYIEVFSIDELFMDATLTAPLFGGVYPLIEKLKKRLREEIGEYITASFGISHNKLLAKLASGLNKPNGIMEITKENVLDVYRRSKLTDICGIGWRIEARLNQMGIYTLPQLRTAPLPNLIAEFGEVEGHFLYNVGLAIDDRPLSLYTEDSGVKSVGRNYCLPRNEYNKRRVLQNLYELCEEVGLKLRRLNKKARTVGFSLRGDTTIHGRKTYAQYMDTGKEIFEGCLLDMNQESGIRNYGLTPLIHNSLFLIPSYVRQISIWVSNLEDAHNTPSSLFELDQKHQKLSKVIDQLNEKFGDHTIRNGFLLYADKLTTVPNGWLADRYERAKLTALS